jgi:hypothetical protein
MHTTLTLSRSAHADVVGAASRDAGCCEAEARCAGCEARAQEMRAARRDAIIHSVSVMRPRRHVR